MITNPVIPIVLSNERSYEADFKGVVYFCDIDKTYLDTEFETIRGLISTLFDFAVDKVNITGMNYLLKGVRKNKNVLNAVYFVSASPKEMRNILKKKLLIDGVQFDGMCLRDQLYYLRKFKFKDIRKTFSFKLTALLIYNSFLPENTEYILIGDNTENDVYIYKVFKKLIETGKVNERILRQFIDDEKELEEIVNFAGSIKKGKVSRIYINRYVKNKFDESEDVVFFDNSLEVMIDLYKTEKMDAFYIKKAVNDLKLSVNLLKDEKDKIILKEILENE